MSEKHIDEIYKSFFDKYGSECLSPEIRIKLPGFGTPEKSGGADWECDCGEMNSGKDMYCRSCKQSRYPICSDELSD